MSRLKITLPTTWSDRSAENSNGSPTYIRHASARPGTLIVSHASYIGNSAVQLDDKGLIELATNLATSGGGQASSARNGNCKMGRFGSVTAVCPQSGSGKIWVLWNGTDCVLVTHYAQGEIDPNEASEAEQIVMDITVR